MKDIHLNNLDTNQRKILQIGVIGILLLFLVLYFVLNKNNPATGNNEVYLKNSTLHVFSDTYPFNGYPDRITVHSPYFIYVQGNKPLTTVYNLETKRKEKEIQDILLDYYDGNIVYNRKETYFNNKNLGEFCDSAFIESNTQVLCITKQSQNYVDNMLIDINPESPNLWKRVYQSDNILTTVSVINDTLYVGEINFETKQNYLTVNGQTIPVETPVNMIYEMNGVPYFASTKSATNEENIYYQIDGDTINKEVHGKIFFYKK